MKLEYYKVNSDVRNPVLKTTGSACFDIPISIRKDFELKYWEPVYSIIENKDYEQSIKQGSIVLSDNKLILVPNNTYLIPTGLIFNIPEGYHIQIHLRSSTGLKKHLAIPSHIGIIDADYRHEVHVPLQVTSPTKVIVNDGDMLAQAMLVKNLEYYIEETKEKPELLDSRSGGFGSTGN